MSASLAVAPRHACAASFSLQEARSPAPWSTQTPPEEQDDPGLNGVVMHFTPDQQIYGEGDESRYFYKVISGVVRTCRFPSDGRRQIDSFLVAGDIFGFEAGADHPLAAEAVSQCSVIAYRRRGLETTITQDHRLGRWFFSHAMTSLSRAREHALLLGRSSAAQKIAAFLLEIDRQEGSRSQVDLPMSRQDIADYLGLTIETVSRTLSQLERNGTIALSSARRVMLQDRRALRALNS
ncbi:MAG TPA: helix-turn-helix domain-containing protein [Rhodopila sp.]|jgi:CRP/FNR family nitrogen fixation transcriptional regulator|nr:helix-turn-helix domain-containing protein [Rhodopila sp.]